VSLERPSRSTRAVLAGSAEEFAEAAEPVIAHASQGGPPASLVAVKVDSPAAATAGTARPDAGVGSALREQVVELIRRNLRGSDVVSPATDDLYVLLRGATHEQGCYVATRLCSAIRNHAFAASGATERARAGVTASMGVASAPLHGSALSTLTAAAARAAAAVSAEGGDGAVVAADGPDMGARRTLDIDRFVGRTEELALLRKMLDEAIAGSPRAVAVLGEVGLGRTALLRQLAPEVRLRGGSLVIARARGSTVRSSYAVWRQVLQAIRRLPDAPERSWHELTNLDPGLHGASEGRAASKYRLLEELAEYIRIASHARPLVLVLEEMQVADAASWDVLDHLLTQVERERLLIGVTLREDPGQTEIVARRQALQRIDAYKEIRLSRLTRDEAKRWLESAMHRQEVGRELLAYIYRHTEGNPFAITQLLRCMVEERSIWHNGTQWEWSPPSELRLPASVEEMIARRLGRLSPATMEVLTTAAVVGREFEVDVLVAAGDGSAERVRAAIDEAVSAEFVHPNNERGGGAQEFVHGKIADVILASTRPDTLTRAHERVARALEGRPRSAPEAAFHFDQAGCQGDAYRLALQAVTEVEAGSHHGNAGEYLEIAARNATTPGDLAEVRVRMAQLAESRGRYDEAEELCDLAIEWFQGQGDRSRALTLRRIRVVARKELGEHTKITLDALKALDEEAEALGNVRERVEILTLISQTYSRIGESKEAERIAAECVQTAEQLGDPALLAGALNRLAITVEPESPQRARAYYERSLALYQQLGDVRGQARCYSNLGIVAHIEGRYDDARKSLTMAISLARAAGFPEQTGLASLNLGVMTMRRGEHDRARELFSDAMTQFAALKNSEMQLYALYNLANLDYELRLFASAAELYEASVSLARRIGHTEIEAHALAREGMCHLDLGHPDAARVSLAALEHGIAGRTGWFSGREFTESLRIRVTAVDGRSREAMELFESWLAAAQAASDRTGAGFIIASCAFDLAQVNPERIREAVRLFANEVRQVGGTRVLKEFGDAEPAQAS
jgi:tetratricopeptide (TPR) repeat protein/GGDEF domain-containing protein